MSAPHIYVVAAETSGDTLGAGFIKELRKLNPDIQFSGIGGRQMSDLGVPSLFDVSPLAILGVLEGLKSYGTVMRLVKTAASDIIKTSPDAVVLIDSWGFMMRVAERLKAKGYQGKIIKYVAPQVWAMREGRTKVLARGVDHLLTIHSFEAPYFTREGLPVTYVGNAVFDTDYTSGDGKALRKEIGAEKGLVLALMLGSRPSEISRLSRPFTESLMKIKDKHPDLSIVTPLARSTEELVRSNVYFQKLLPLIHVFPEERKLDIFAAADLALAASGTVTTQLSSAGVPTVVGYKLGSLSYMLAKRMFKADYVSIVNLAAKEELLPEMLQHECEPEYIAPKLTEWIEDAKQRKALSQKLLAQTQKMKAGEGNASLKAARAVLNVVKA